MSTAKKNRFVPAVESLEERRLMTAGVTAVLQNRILTVTGTNGDDKIVFRETSTIDQVFHHGPPIHFKDQLCQVSIEGVSIREGAASDYSISRSAFDRIVIDTGDGNDVVDLSALHPSYEHPRNSPNTLVFMSAPEAHVRGGNGHRTLYATRGGLNFAEGPLGTNELHGAWHLVGQPKGADTFVNDPYLFAPSMALPTAVGNSTTTPAVSAARHQAASDALFATLATGIQ